MTETTTPTPARRTAVAALGRAGTSGVAVGLWYSLPDYVDRRRSRVLAKLAILAGAGAVFARRQDSDQGVVPPAESTTSEQASAAQGRPADQTAGPRARLQRLNPGILIALGATVLIAGIGANVATERWIHRFGERLKANGTSHPHTAIGLVAGSLTVLASLNDFPSPRE